MTWKHFGALSFKSMSLFLNIKHSSYNKLSCLSAHKGSWPLCVYFLICHFTPLSLKCHTVTSTSVLMGEWSVMGIRFLHCYDELYRSKKKKFEMNVTFSVIWFVLGVRPQWTSKSNFALSRAFKIVSSAFYFCVRGCWLLLCYWTWFLCLQCLGHKWRLCQHPMKTFSQLTIFSRDQTSSLLWGANTHIKICV